MQLVVLAATVALAACAPAGPNPSGQSSKDQPDPRQQKTLIVAWEEEPTNLAIPFGAGGGVTGTDLRLAVHQHLVTYTDRGEVKPMLAVEVPDQAKGTWTVRPDGTMQTTYRLQPNVTWHDGERLRAEDFVLAWTVTRDPEIPTTSRTVSSLIDRIETPDDHTLVIEWKSTYPFANAIVEDDLGPIPAHLLAALYQADKERFVQAPYWTREFVGVGPYRLGDWEPGSHLTLHASDRFHLGRAKIDTIVLRFFGDENALVTALLAGAVDGEIPAALQFEQATFVRRQWEQAGRQPVVVVQPEKWRHIFVQFRDPHPVELSDVRVRRALLHAVDREALVATLLDGQVPISDWFVPPSDPAYEWVKDVMVRYPYDPGRALQLLGEVGWTQRGDGSLGNAAGAPVTLPVWADIGRQDEQELAILGTMWKAIGLQVEQSVVTVAQQRDVRYRASFTGLYAKQAPLSLRNSLTRAYGPACPTEQTRWVGNAIGCYQNERSDRLSDALRMAIDPAQQRELYRELVAFQTQELPVLPLYYQASVTLFRDGVTGVKGGTVPRTSATWNIAEWDVS
jgi:peptide/nickel transport system substrate-binding protein